MTSIGDILAWAAAYRQAILGLVLILLAIVAIIHWWDAVRFWMMRVRYSLPVIGKAKSLSRDTSVGENGWFGSELTLCGEFQSNLIRLKCDPANYDRAKNYLRKVHELGRSPLSIWGWILLCALVFVESLGFAYVLAGYTLPGASESLQIPGAVGIAFLISVALVFLTHGAGQEWHKRNLVQKARVFYENDEPVDQRKNLIGNAPTRLDQDETDDEDENKKKEKSYIQLIRRLDTNANVTPGVPGRNILAIFAITLIAAFAFYVRYQTYERDQTCATIGGQASTPDIFSGLQNLLNTQPSLPKVITDPQRANEQKGQDEQCAADKHANVGTYIILAVVFVIVQIIGWTMGHRTGFAGTESRDAWQISARFRNKQEYVNWCKMARDKVIGISQRHLSNLQRLLAKNIRAGGVSVEETKAIKLASTRTFRKYVDEYKDNDEENAAPK